MAGTGETILGRYQLERMLGEGSMGQVHLAHDLELDRTVAVKLSRSSMDAAGLARFEREAQVLARVRHPNLVQVFDAGRSGEQVFLVMEYLEGQDLEATPPDDPLGAMLEVAQGLQALHAAGVLHRDLKPSNVLRTSRGEVKLLDLGLAWTDGAVNLTQSGFLVGTPHYLAPERYSGVPGTPASDWYSWGACLYALYEGRPPFTFDQVALASHGDPLPALVWTKTEDARVHALVASCLDLDPERRPQTLGMLRSSLGSVGGARRRRRKRTGPSASKRDRERSARLGHWVVPVLAVLGLGLGVGIVAKSWWARAAPGLAPEPVGRTGFSRAEAEVERALGEDLYGEYRRQGFGVFGRWGYVLEALPQVLTAAPVQTMGLRDLDRRLVREGLPAFFAPYLAPELDAGAEAWRAEAEAALAAVDAAAGGLEAGLAEVAEQLPTNLAMATRVSPILLEPTAQISGVYAHPEARPELERVTAAGSAALRRFLVATMQACERGAPESAMERLTSAKALHEYRPWMLPSLIQANARVLFGVEPRSAQGKRFLARVVLAQQYQLRGLQMPMQLFQEDLMRLWDGDDGEAQEQRRRIREDLFAAVSTP